MGQVTATILIRLAPANFVAAIVLGLVEIDLNIRVVFPVTAMAITGMILRQMRERDDHDKQMLIATIERLSRDDSLQPVLRRIR